MPNNLLTEAIREAYASAPSNIVILDTLEIRHPSFANPIRVVRDYQDLTATLESNAPSQAGEAVLFTAYNFDINLPSITTNANAQATLTIDNVSRQIIDNIELALNSMDEITVIYRPYFNNDTSSPQYEPVLTFSLSDIVVDISKVVGRLSFGDLANMSFPSEIYSANLFFGLVR